MTVRRVVLGRVAVAAGRVGGNMALERVDGRGALGTWFQMEAPGCSGLDPKHAKPEAVMGCLMPSHLQKCCALALTKDLRQ